MTLSLSMHILQTCALIWATIKLMFCVILGSLLLTMASLVSIWLSIMLKSHHATSSTLLHSPGTDNIPSCFFFKNCSYEITEILTHILNLSLCSGSVQNQWRGALVTLIPKVHAPKPVAFSAFGVLLQKNALYKFTVIRHFWLSPNFSHATSISCRWEITGC